MANANLTQLRRLVFRKWNGTAWDVFTLEPDDLGQDTIISFNIAPLKKSRSSSLGTSETPVPGTFDTLSATVTFIADNWKIFGKALQNWNPATYTGAGNNGNIVGDDSSYCSGDYLSVIAQGVCDDGSSTDIEFTRCIPSADDDVELGTSESAEVSLALNPIVYNALTHAGDGYPAYTYRLGDYDLTAKKRLNAATGEYVSA